MKEELPHVFIIGSSITLMYGQHLKKMLTGFFRYSRKGEEPEAIQKAFENLDIPQGASAGDSSMVLEYLKELEKNDSFNPAVVMLTVGGHDIKIEPETKTNRIPLPRFCQNLEAIVAWFKKRSIPLVWVPNGPMNEKLHNERMPNYPRYDADLKAYNRAAADIMARNGAAILDLPKFTANLGPIEEILADHVHFTDDVAQKQAAFIAGYLMQYRFRQRLSMPL